MSSDIENVKSEKIELTGRVDEINGNGFFDPSTLQKTFSNKSFCRLRRRLRRKYKRDSLKNERQRAKAIVIKVKTKHFKNAGRARKFWEFDDENINDGQEADCNNNNNENKKCAKIFVPLENIKFNGKNQPSDFYSLFETKLNKLCREPRFVFSFR
jgi:hypothetical protein